MNPEEVMKMFAQQQQQNCLLRKPTEEEIDTFIDRCCKEKDETLYTLFQALAFKIERSVHSIPEGEIYPLVLERIKQKLEGGEQ